MRKYVFILIFLFWPFLLQQDPDVRRVLYVVDGDTIIVNHSNGKEEKIRLIGIDAPELRDSDTGQPQQHARNAKNYLSELVSGKTVRLQYDKEHYDKYGRTLAYIYLTNGLFVNGEMVRKGYAQTLNIAPNGMHAWHLADLQKEAKKAKRGIWEKK